MVRFTKNGLLSSEITLSDAKELAKEMGSANVFHLAGGDLFMLVFLFRCDPVDFDRTLSANQNNWEETHEWNSCIFSSGSPSDIHLILVEFCLSA